MKLSELKQIIKEEIRNVLKEDTNTFAAAALELVNIAEPMIADDGYVDDLNPERKRSARVKNADQLSDFYFNLYNTLAELAGTKSAKFAREAKKIIVDKYKLSITDEYGSPMKFK